MKDQVLLSYTKGIRHTPSDILCEDGELEECVNLEVRDNELTPVEMPAQLHFTMEESEVLLLVHNLSSGGKNYVSETNGVIRFFNAVFASKEYFSLSIELGKVKSIQGIGNTVVIYTEESPHYFLYSNMDYKYLGSKIPEINLSFNLRGGIDYSEEFPVQMNQSYDGKLGELDSLTDEQSDLVTPQIVAQVNKFIGEKSGEGYFIFPFFVRYAYKMYDGTNIMQSAPILMMPSTTKAPYCIIQDVNGYNIETYVGSYCARPIIVYDLVNEDLADWKDIIKGIDVFTSRQVYTFDQEGKVEGLKTYQANVEEELFDSLYYGTKTRKDADSSTYGKYELGYNVITSYKAVGTGTAWKLPFKSSEDINDEIVASSNFYLYKSYSIDQFSKTFTEDGDEEISLANMETGLTLKDDYMTHDVLVPKFSFLYNSRLNISNIQRKIFEGFKAEGIAQYVSSGSNKYTIYTYINSSGGDIIVKSDSEKFISIVGTYLFYPDSDAYKMVIVNNSAKEYAEVDLIGHPLLNGAYWFSSFNPLTFKSGSPTISPTNNVEYMANTLMLSEVNNPFHFPLEGIYTVGSSGIIGMSSVTRPISQGQFGEFPMIAFCSDGNFAMRVDAQGLYSGISPVQEDIVLGADKVVSMENSVAVITQKGIMLTSGNEMTPVATDMKGGVFDNSKLPNLAVGDTGISLIVNNSKEKFGFLDYLYGSKMAFDYASSRLLIYNPDKTYSYFYSLENDTTTKFVLPNGAKLITSVIDYPDYILQDDSGKLYSLYNKDDVNVLTDEMFGFALTRPLKLGKALSYKSIMELKNIKAVSSSECYVKYRLYGSNDNRKYYHIKSRFGKPYKYYRIAIYTKLLPKDAFVGTALTVDYRRTHKFR